MKNLLKLLTPLALIGSLAFSQQKPETPDFYATFKTEAFFPSDFSTQQFYWTMPAFRAGFGVELYGWAAELCLACISKEQPFLKIHIGDSYMALNSRFTDLQAAIRFSKSASRKGEKFRPYSGVQFFYNYLTESISAEYSDENLRKNSRFTSTPAIFSGFGIGIFEEIDFILSKNVSFYLEGMYNYSPVRNIANSDSFDSGGISGGAGIKFYFK
jgi:hypothetical protein